MCELGSGFGPGITRAYGTNRGAAESARRNQDTGDAVEAAHEGGADGWTFQASFHPPGESCQLSITADLAPDGEQRWTLPVTGPAGAYEVDLFGRGRQGDVSVTFAMQSTADGSVPAPTATLGLFYDNDGVPTSYGPAEFGVIALAGTPVAASGTITVTAADGTRSTVELSRTDSGCEAVGSVNLIEVAEPPAEGRDVVAMFGPAPYTIEVDLTLDGTRYRGEVAWPDDVDEEMSVLVVDFEPPLPQATAADYRPFVG